VAFALLWVAGVSDGLDGLLARVLELRTTLGQYLDPIADKLLLSTLFVVLTHVGAIPRYVTVLVLSRDIGILLIATLLFATHTLRELSSQQAGQGEYCGADSGRADGDDLPGVSRAWAGGSEGRAIVGDCGAGTGVGRGICVDCGAASERATDGCLSAVAAPVGCG
jgi:hypothetical protein